MGIKDVFEISAAILASLGGSSAIIFGLSSWLGKVWANRILEKEKLEHNRELEKYRKDLSEELERVRSINDKALYVSKVHYNNEYRIYEDIWAKLHECVVYTLMLYPEGVENTPDDKEELERYQTQKYENYVMRYNDFSMTIDKYAPFYKKEFYDLFVELRILCSSQGNFFRHWEIDRKYNHLLIGHRDIEMPDKIFDEVWTKNPDKIKNAKAELSEKIREYLLSLQLI